MHNTKLLDQGKENATKLLEYEEILEQNLVNRTCR